MELMECLLIIVGAIIVLFLLVAIVLRITAYYRQRFNMSVWPGMLMLALAVVMLVYSIYHYRYFYMPIVIAAGILLLITCILDMAHAGFGMGLLALIFQTVLAAAFILVIIIAIILMVVRSLRKGDDLVLDAVTGTSSRTRNRARLFFRFFVP